MYDEKCLTQIGRNIRFWRMACQISQQEMAESIGISQTHLSNLERNRVQVSMKLLLRIANVLDCSVEKFLQVRELPDWQRQQGLSDTNKDTRGLDSYTSEEIRQLLQLLAYVKPADSK